MKIHYLAFIRLPTEKAHGLQIMKTCEALAENGAEVELVVPGRKTHVSGDPFSYYGAKKNFTVTNLKTPDLVRWGTPGFLISLLCFAERLVWRKEFWNADAVYSRDALVLLQYLLLGRPLYYEAHNDPSPISMTVARAAKRVFSISEGLKSAYVARGIPEAKIVVVPDAVDAAFFAESISKEDARRKYNLPLDARIALYAGRIEERKGAAVFAEASEHLSGGAAAVLAGGGSMRSVLEKRYPKAVFLGELPYQDMPSVHRAADVLVLPNSARFTESARNTSPLKLFAYMASGVPILASDVPAVREILSEYSAFFVRPDDSGALAKGIERALTDIDSGKKANQARRLAEGYSWPRRAAGILSAIREV